MEYVLETNAITKEYKHCEAVGTNVQDYSRQDEVKGILYDNTYHISEHSNQGVSIPLLNLKKGSQLQITENLQCFNPWA